MLRLLILAICGGGLVALPVSAGTCGPWGAFIENPTERHQALLADSLRNCDGADCARFAVPDSELDGFCDLVERGDSLAVELGMLCLRGLDGGNLEDVMRSLGSVVDKNATLVLRLAKKTGLTRNELDGAIGMLPENVIDHPKRRRKAIQRRLASLERVSNPSLAELRDEAVRTLRDYLKELDQ